MYRKETIEGNNSMSSSCEEFITKLQKERTDYKHASQVRMQANSLKQLSVGIYTEPERFVYELLQNAVDAFSDTNNETLNILIKAEDDRFVFMHNGKAFDTKDVEGISDVGNGTKSNDSKKIGYKGIGFKSVFMPSVDCVGIISGDFCFEFNKNKAFSLMPIFPQSEGELNPNDVPWQVIPIYAPQLQELSKSEFNVTTIVHTSDANIIGARIEDLFLDLQFLLFLRSNNVNIRFERNGQVVLSVGKQHTDDPSDVLPKVTLYKDGEAQSQWMLFTKEVVVPKEVKNAIETDFNTPDKLKGAEKVEISFAVQIRGNEVVPLKNTSVFTFLPTSYRGLRQPFLINSNFITDAGRQQLHQESEWNKLIFSKIPELYLEFVSVFSKHFSNFSKVLPCLAPDNDTLVSEYKKALKNAFESVAFIPNRNGKILLKIGDVLVDKTGISKGIIPIDKLLTHINKTMHTHFTTDNFVENDGIVSYAHDYINIFGEEELLQLFMDREITSGMSIEDDITLVRFLFDYYDKSGIDMDSLSDIAILYDDEGKFRRFNELFFPSDFQRRNSETSDVFILNEDIYDNIKNDTALIEWLESLGVRELSNDSFVEYILDHNDYITEDNALSIGRFLFQVWKKENFLDRGLNSDKIKDLHFLANDGKLHPISNLYLGSQYKPEDDMESAYDQPEQYISDDYPERIDSVDDWSFFLKKCGVSYKIRIVAKDYIAKELKLEFIQKTEESFRDYPHSRTNYCGFKNSIEKIHFQVSYFPFIKFDTPKYDLDKFILSKILPTDRYDLDIDDKVYGSVHYWCTKITKKLSEVAPHEFTSRYDSFLEYVIANKQMFPTTQGTSEKPTKVFINYSDNKELGGKYLPILAIETKVHESWLEIIPFKRNLTIEDLLDVLDKISIDTDSDLDEKKERISKIYREFIKRDEQNSSLIKEWAKTHKILAMSGDFIPAVELTYITVDGFKNNGNKVYCEKVGKDNRDKMLSLLKTFGVQVITQKDIDTVFTNSVENNELKIRLMDKAQYLAVLRHNGKGDYEDCKMELEKIIQSTHFYHCESISLTYGEDKDTISKATFSKGDCFYYTGNINPTRIEPLLSPLCNLLHLGNSNDSKLMVILLTRSHQELVDYLIDCGYEVGMLQKENTLSDSNEIISDGKSDNQKSSIIGRKVSVSEYDTEENAQIIEDSETLSNNSIITIHSNAQDEIDRQVGRVIRRDGVPLRVQIAAHNEAESIIRTTLIEKGFDCSNWILNENGDYNYNQVENIITPDGESVNVVYKSAKGGYIYLSATDFEFLTSYCNNILMVWDGENVHSVTAEDIFNRDSNVNLIFDTEYTPKHYYAALSKVFQYIKRTTFAVKNPSYNPYEIIKSFGMDSETEGVQELFDDKDAL